MALIIVIKACSSAFKSNWRLLALCCPDLGSFGIFLLLLLPCLEVLLELAEVFDGPAAAMVLAYAHVMLMRTSLKGHMYIGAVVPPKHQLEGHSLARFAESSLTLASDLPTFLSCASSNFQMRT